MLKIRSKIDVITNSSSEVFLLNVSGNLLEEVAKDIECFVVGGTEPEVLKMGEGLMDTLIDWKLFDPKSARSMEIYRRSEIQQHNDPMPYLEDDDSIPKETIDYWKKRLKARKGIFRRWVDFAVKNRDKIKEYQNSGNKKSWPAELGKSAINHTMAGRRQCELLIDPFDYHLYDPTLPKGLFSQFYRENKRLFDKIPLPDDMNARKFVGKVGFSREQFYYDVDPKGLDEFLEKYPGTTCISLG